MSLHIHAAFEHAGVGYQVTGESIEAVQSIVNSIKGVGTGTGVGPGATGTAVGSATDKAESVKPGKSAKAEKPAASSQPAAETSKGDTAASEKKADKPASTVKPYPETDLPDRISKYLGDKVADPDGHAKRRGALVELFTSFNVKKGPELKAEQCAEFSEALAKLENTPASDEDDLS